MFVPNCAQTIARLFHFLLLTPHKMRDFTRRGVRVSSNLMIVDTDMPKAECIQKSVTHTQRKRQIIYYKQELHRLNVICADCLLSFLCVDFCCIFPPIYFENIKRDFIITECFEYIYYAGCRCRNFCNASV